jgi:hypothetical protein
MKAVRKSIVAPVWGLEIIHRLDVSILDGTNTIPMTVPLVGLTNFPTVMEIRDVSVLDYRSLECPRQDFFFNNDSLHFRSKLHCSSVVGYVHNVTGSKDLSRRKFKKVSKPFANLHSYDDTAKGTCSHNQPKNKCFLITVDVSENVHLSLLV